MNKVQINVLDHGYVKFIEASGTGEAGVDLEGEYRGCGGGNDYEVGIIEAARQSTQGNFRGWEEDQKLLAFLFNSKPQHATPFEFSDMVIEVQAPIFVYREWHRHRTQSYNEMSARYAPLPDLNYWPDWENMKQRGEASTKNKQAQGTQPWNEVTADLWWRELHLLYQNVEAHYQRGLKAGVPKEIARIGLPVARYSRMRAKANLRNWLAFLTLRADPGAMWEIQQYANAVGEFIKDCFPRTWELYCARREVEKNPLMKFTKEQLSQEIFERTHNSNHPLYGK